MSGRGFRRRRWQIVVLVGLLIIVGVVVAGVMVPSAATPPAAAARVLVSSREGRVVDWTVRSPSVPGEQPVRILLPQSYDAHPKTRWPVLYLLHGCCDTFASWTRSTDVLQFTENAGVIIVMPDGGRAGFYSDWRHGPRWERYHVVELPRLLASRFRVNGRAAIAGPSMGGRGALDYAARHPGRYVAAASFSGMVDSSLSDYEPTIYLNLLLNEGVDDPNDLWGDPTRQAPVWRAHDPYDLAARLKGTALILDGVEQRSTDLIEQFERRFAGSHPDRASFARWALRDLGWVQDLEELRRLQGMWPDDTQWDLDELWPTLIERYAITERLGGVHAFRR